MVPVRDGLTEGLRGEKAAGVRGHVDADNLTTVEIKDGQKA